MPRTGPLFSHIVLLALAILSGSQAAAQELKSCGIPRWDSTNEVLFFDGCSGGGVVRAYADGHQRGADIDIIKDFPGIQDCYVVRSTAGPDGTTLIAPILKLRNECQYSTTDSDLRLFGQIAEELGPGSPIR